MSEEEAVTQEGPGDDPGAGEQEAEVADSESAPESKQPANELKVVIVMKSDNVLLGVQAPECDPVYTTLKGDLAKALKKVPGLVAEAKQKWEAAPLNPKCETPLTPPPTTRPSTPEKPKPQPAMF